MESARRASSRWAAAGESRHHAGGQRLRLVVAAADDERRGDVVFAEIIERGDVGGVQLDRAGEAGLHLARQGKAGDEAGMARLHAVGAAQPELIVAGLDVGGSLRRRGELALVDGLVGFILRVEDAAQQLMRGGVRGIGGEGGAQQVGGIVDPAFHQGVVGGRVGAEGAVGGCDVRRSTWASERQLAESKGRATSAGETSDAIDCERWAGRAERGHGGGVWAHAHLLDGFHLKSIAEVAVGGCVEGDGVAFGEAAGDLNLR